MVLFTSLLDKDFLPPSLLCIGLPMHLSAELCGCDSALSSPGRAVSLPKSFQQSLNFWGTFTWNFRWRFLICFKHITSFLQYTHIYSFNFLCVSAWDVCRPMKNLHTVQLKISWADNTCMPKYFACFLPFTYLPSLTFASMLQLRLQSILSPKSLQNLSSSLWVISTSARYFTSHSL